MRERARVVVLSGLLGSLLPCLAAGCAGGGSPSAAAIIGTMRDLTVAQVLTKDAIEKALEADLKIDAGSSHEMVTFFTGSPRPGSRFEKTVKLIDLRVPTPKNDVMRDPFLVIELREEAGVTANDAKKLLGLPTEVQVPEPNLITASSYVYAFGPHKLWISIGRGSGEPLHSLAIHRNEAQ